MVRPGGLTRDLADLGPEPGRVEEKKKEGKTRCDPADPASRPGKTRSRPGCKPVDFCFFTKTTSFWFFFKKIDPADPVKPGDPVKTRNPGLGPGRVLKLWFELKNIQRSWCNINKWMNMAASMQWIQEFWSTKTPNQATLTCHTRIY
jgi:hypothetical protein